MRPFDVRSDYQTMVQWFLKRGTTAPPLDYLPPSGLVVDGVAMGFLIRTDAKIGILDFFVTNPDVEYLSRSMAIEEIIGYLTLQAKWTGIKKIKCDTKYKNIEDLVLKLNFEYMGEQKFFVKGL